MSVWTPLFEESTESEIVAKMMVVIHRDTKGALDYKFLDSPTYLTRYGQANSVGATGEDLPNFAVMTEGPQEQFSYPLLVIVVQEGASEETVSGEWLDQEIRVHLAYAVDGPTIKAVRLKAKKYTWALKAVLRKAILELLPPITAYTDYSIGFRWRYLKQGAKDTTAIQEAEMLMSIKFGEK